MAKIHVLQGAGLNTYTVVVHATTPLGNNAAAVAWTDALKNSGLATSILAVGTGVGQITQNEMNQITNGTLFEATAQIGVDPSWNNTQLLASLDAQASNLVAEKQTLLQEQLKYFGFTRN